MNLKKYIINGIAYNVSVNSLTDDKAEVTVNGVTYQVDIENVRQNVPATDREMEPAATVADREGGSTGRFSERGGQIRMFTTAWGRSWDKGESGRAYKGGTDRGCAGSHEDGKRHTIRI